MLTLFLDPLDLVLGPGPLHDRVLAAPGGGPGCPMNLEIEATRVTQRPALLVLPPGRGGGGRAVGAGHHRPRDHRSQGEHDGLLRDGGRDRVVQEAGVKLHQGLGEGHRTGD